MAEQNWKCGDEFLPFHQGASHVPPDYRDGWNAAYQAALSCATDAMRYRWLRDRSTGVDWQRRDPSGWTECNCRTSREGMDSVIDRQIEADSLPSSTPSHLTPQEREK